MHIVKIKDVAKQDRAKGVYLYYLSKKHLIKRYKMGKSLAFDEDEYNEYRKKERRGRPNDEGEKIVEIKPIRRLKK